MAVVPIDGCASDSFLVSPTFSVSVARSAQSNSCLNNRPSLPVLPVSSQSIESYNLESELVRIGTAIDQFVAHLNSVTSFLTKMNSELSRGKNERVVEGERTKVVFTSAEDEGKTQITEPAVIGETKQEVDSTVGESVMTTEMAEVSDVLTAGVAELYPVGSDGGKTVLNLNDCAWVNRGFLCGLTEALSRDLDTSVRGGT